MQHYYVHNLSPHLIRFSDSFGIHWYGLAYVLGFYACYLVMRYLAKRQLTQLRPDQVADFVTLTALFGVVLGGRLGYVLLYGLEEYRDNPLEALKLWKGGMASHGGIAGVALFTLWYARKHRISWVGLGDTLVCGAPLGILMGRVANFINGELFGRITDVRWAVKFPTEIHHQDFLSRIPAPERFESFPEHSPDILAVYQRRFGDVSDFIALLNPRHPSQLYEAFGEGLLLFLVLFCTRIRFPRLPVGLLTAAFFLGYAVVRIALENYREPDSGSQAVLGFTKGQFYSIFMVAVGLAFLAYALTRGRRTKEGS